LIGNDLRRSLTTANVFSERKSEQTRRFQYCSTRARKFFFPRCEWPFRSRTLAVESNLISSNRWRQHPPPPSRRSCMS